jgi:hypothetical protein
MSSSKMQIEIRLRFFLKPLMLGKDGEHPVGARALKEICLLDAKGHPFTEVASCISRGNIENYIGNFGDLGGC